MSKIDKSTRNTSKRDFRKALRKQKLLEINFCVGYIALMLNLGKNCGFGREAGDF